MTLKANDVKFIGGKQAPVLEPANYPARVAQVIDLGLQPQRPWQGEEKAPAYDIMVTYELGTEFMPDEDGAPDPEKPRWISERFSLFSLKSERAKSTKRYLVLDPKVEHGGDWSELLGAACLVAVVNNQNKQTGKVYNNVGGISAPIKGMDVPELVNPSKFFDLSDPNMEVFNALPQWIQEIITSNLEYKGSVLETLIEGDPYPPEEEQQEQTPPQVDAADDDDVPF